ncbi:DUF998 domain-containing protein [Crassaminicella profunda]|uniref:DUF998 domain-containing protein n=1 Tax=Crassaminicella profunda TaxID=1286698 RepID=UPI001CA6298D|nr:DUF998 domain-containing protein [Crassaminicella profunda]QZY53775.1 DUF998 domain-containing protein [Crassaminicella profunda]
MNKFFNTSLSWGLLIIAIVGDFIVPYILANFYKGYNHKRMVMSTLGNPNSPVRIYYNIWLVILGILLIITSFNLYQYYFWVSKPLSIAVFVLILFFAIGAGILAGIFSVNESKEMETIASKIHGVGSALGFMALLFVPLLLSILSFKIKDLRTAIVCLISFVFSLIFFVLFIMSDKSQLQYTIIANEGIWQRLLLLFMYLPFGYIAIRNIVALM